MSNHGCFPTGATGGMVHNGASVYTLHMFLNCPFFVKLNEFGDVFSVGLLFTTLCHVKSGRY